MKTIKKESAIAVAHAAIAAAAAQGITDADAVAELVLAALAYHGY